MHCHVQGHDLVEFQKHVAANVLLEARLVKLGPVGAHRNLDEGKVAAVICLCLPAHTCRFIHQSDFNVGQDSSAGIGDPAQDSAAGALRQKKRGARETKQDD